MTCLCGIICNPQLFKDEHDDAEDFIFKMLHPSFSAALTGGGVIFDFGLFRK